jgi:hypothetical protein
MIRPKSQNLKIEHDGILSIGNFILMIKNHILLFQLLTNNQKMCSLFPWQHGISYLFKFSSLHPDGLRNFFDLFSRKIQDFLKENLEFSKSEKSSE